MDSINASFTFFPLPHSMQIYWQTIASTLCDVFEDMIHLNQLDEHDIISVTNAIITANTCADLYGEVIRVPIAERQTNKISENNYINNEIVFYNQLITLLLNEDFYTNLQNVVREEVNIGTRYFTRFLSVIGVE
jgi:hypothetical protein